MDAVNILLEITGWVASLLILLGYTLFSMGRIPNGPLYQSLNFAGAALALVYVASKSAWPSVVVNFIWGIVALVVLIRMLVGGWAKRKTARAIADHTLEDAVPLMTTPIHLIDTLTQSIPVVATPGPVPVSPAVQDHLEQDAIASSSLEGTDYTLQDLFDSAAEIDEAGRAWEERADADDDALTATTAIHIVRADAPSGVDARPGDEDATPPTRPGAEDATPPTRPAPPKL